MRNRGTRSADKWCLIPSSSPNADEILGVVLELSDELSCTPAQVATRWALDQLYDHVRNRGRFEMLNSFATTLEPAVSNWSREHQIG